MERIFDEFAQLDDRDGNAHQGWGLGLAICQRLVRRLGGELALESEPNHGSIFMIHLPAMCVVNRSQAGMVSN